MPRKEYGQAYAAKALEKTWEDVIKEHKRWKAYQQRVHDAMRNSSRVIQDDDGLLLSGK